MFLENLNTHISKDIPIREYKFARTKLELLSAYMRRISAAPASEIKITDLCKDVRVSEKTFFNYFEKKSDLLGYYIDLWQIYAISRVNQITKNTKGISFINALFAETAKCIEDDPHMMFEIITGKASQLFDFIPKKISRAERLIAFPELRQDALQIDPAPLKNIFTYHLQAAQDKKELSIKSHTDMASIALIAIFYGVPVAVGIKDYKNIRAVYKAQLEMLWTALKYK